MMKPESNHDPLFSRVCDGLASEADLTALHRLLRDDPNARDAWLHYSALHGELAGGELLAEPVPSEAREPRSTGLRRPRAWFPWLPQAAAGVVVGLMAATVMWAYVRTPTAKSFALLDEDFENPSAVLAVRTALETGVWRGDAAEIVGAQQGVTPARGHHMLRMLRDEVDGRPKPAGGHIAVAYRMIDLRPYQSELADGGAVIEVSASFNARAFPEMERFGCAISLYALDADSVPDRAGRLGSILLNDALAMARSGRTLVDHDPGSWQRLTTELRIPSNAEFLVVRLHINQMFESAPDFVFTGSYVDDVRVSLTRRAPLP